jgi:hypothetical protein
MIPNPETAETAFHILNQNGITTHLPSLALSSLTRSQHLFGQQQQQQQKHRHFSPNPTSPYGNPQNWDVLWIGHCGSGFPRHPNRSAPAYTMPPLTSANTILTYPDDPTVPITKHLKAHPFQGTLDPLALAYPNHTRIYHRATGGQLCTVGYAVSQRGARRLLHQFGIKGWNGIFDAELGRWCAGEDPNMGTRGNVRPKEKRAGKERICLTSQPPLLAHHHPQEGESDIGGLGGGYAR